MVSRRRRVAVVGAGVSGLTAAYRLRRHLGDDARIDVWESSGRIGGLLHTVEVGGRHVDVGAEAFIVRRPEVLDLVSELGLDALMVHPSPRRPSIYALGRLHSLPTPALMGIPAVARTVDGLVDDDDLARIADEPSREWNWSPSHDPSVGELVAERFGPSVVARSVDPMLGGVYSSLASDIGVREAIPALAARLDAGAPGLSAAVGDLTPTANTGGGPIFATLRGGYRRLVEALQEAAGATVHLESPVERLESQGSTVTLTVHDGRTHDYDGVIVATPPWVAARLLADAAPEASSVLGDVPPAGSAVVSLALAPGTALPEHSGVLVATGEALGAKAFTFSSQKWGHLSEDRDAPVSVRASFGRFADPVEADDATLVRRALADLDEVCAQSGLSAVSASCVDAVVARWPQGLPLYRPGHLSAMRRVQESSVGRVRLAGAVYAGVGVPACVGQASGAASSLAADLA